jgi:tRNA 2-thiouridine synthesizing protein B
MSTLHTVNTTSASNALSSCLRVAQSGDALLFLEDGVYHALQLADYSQFAGLEVFAVQEDIAARGLETANMPTIIQRISYAEFVELVCQYQRSVSWF